MNEAKQVLEGALKLLQRPRGWTKGEGHRRVTYKGRRVNAYCAIGAIYAARPISGHAAAMAVLRGVIRGQYIAGWNDKKSQTKKNVIATFKKAIAKLS